MGEEEGTQRERESIHSYRQSIRESINSYRTKHQVNEYQ